jgi:hypothetical protein
MILLVKAKRLKVGKYKVIAVRNKENSSTACCVVGQVVPSILKGLVPSMSGSKIRNYSNNNTPSSSYPRRIESSTKPPQENC